MAKNKKFTQSAGGSRAEPELEPGADLPSQRDPQFEREVQRLYRLRVYGKWLAVGLIWLTIAPFCLWHLRSEFALWRDHFTWTAVRFSLSHNRLAAAGLAFCIYMTVSTLLWHSRNLLWGLPAGERKQLEKEVLSIRRSGKNFLL